MSVFVTADQHLGDDRFEIMQRPFFHNYDQTCKIVKEHNLVVTETDMVIFNGDVSYTKEHLSYVGHLAGKKTLIRGNHDRKFSDKELKVYFDTIIDEGDWSF